MTCTRWGSSRTSCSPGSSRSRARPRWRSRTSTSRTACPRPPSVLPDLPDELDGFVAAATDRDRELRPESADVMRMDLDAHLATSSRPPGGSPRSCRTLPSITVEGGETTEVGVRLETGVDPADGAPPETAPDAQAVRRRGPPRSDCCRGAAWGTWTYAIPHTAVIPELQGATVDAARDRLTELGFEVVLVDGRYDMQVPAGHVLGGAAGGRCHPRTGDAGDDRALEGTTAGRRPLRDGRAAEEGEGRPSGAPASASAR